MSIMEREKFEDIGLIAEAAGREQESSLSYYQEANLAYWDNFIDGIFEKYKTEREEINRRNRESDSYQQRTNKQLSEL